MVVSDAVVVGSQSLQVVRAVDLYEAVQVVDVTTVSEAVQVAVSVGHQPMHVHRATVRGLYPEIAALCPPEVAHGPA